MTIESLYINDVTNEELFQDINRDFGRVVPV
jgi:hypothetical protein